MAKLKERMFGVPDGEIHPRWFEAGDEVTGELEAAALAEGKIAPHKAGNAKAVAAAPENKAVPGPTAPAPSAPPAPEAAPVAGDAAPEDDGAKA